MNWIIFCQKSNIELNQHKAVHDMLPCTKTYNIHSVLLHLGRTARHTLYDWHEVSTLKPLPCQFNKHYFLFTIIILSHLTSSVFTNIITALLIAMKLSYSNTCCQYSYLIFNILILIIILVTPDRSCSSQWYDASERKILLSPTSLDDKMLISMFTLFSISMIIFIIAFLLIGPLVHNLFKEEKLDNKVGHSWCLSINANAMMSQNFRNLIVSHPFCSRKKSWAKSVKYPRMTDTYCFWSVETLDSCQENDKEGLWSITSNQMVELVNLVLILMIMLTHGCQRFLQNCYHIHLFTLVQSIFQVHALITPFRSRN